jgi:PHD/YefM family antitoxin component YafN of YafNO toxin-antitoxin module
MKVYTFSEARQNFATVLENAQKEGAVRITRRDGRMFTIQPVLDSQSPLAVKAVRLKLSRDEIVGAIREGRERTRGA